MFQCNLVPGACALSLKETTYDTKPGEKIHTLHIRLMILFFPFKCSSGSTVQAGCVLLCCFIVITALVIYLILPLVLEVEWGHVGSFTGISRE